MLSQNMTPKIILPFRGNFPITQKFGAASNWYVSIYGYPHNGIDYAMPERTPIYAVDDGKITYADNTPDRDGLGINTEHEWGMSQYWHLSTLEKSAGDIVKKGDRIGLSGNTGFSTGPHLHFGIKVNDAGAAGMRGWTDPTPYFLSENMEPELTSPVKKRYFVKSGDTLWGISEKFYGNGIYWKKIYEANKGIIKNPNVIKTFQLLEIP